MRTDDERGVPKWSPQFIANGAGGGGLGRYKGRGREWDLFFLVLGKR